MSAGPNSVTHVPRSTGAETAGLVGHLQSIRETERVFLARRLHDDLGALLVAAVMDIGWAEQHLESSGQVKDVLRRARSSLAAAIDLKRNLIEDLRPSLLDNFGLFAAFRWHVRHVASRAGLACTEHYPTDELKFRIVQDLLRVILSEPDLKSLDIVVSTAHDRLTIQISHEHSGREMIELAEWCGSDFNVVAHRVDALGGKLSTERGQMGTACRAEFSLSDLLRSL